MKISRSESIKDFFQTGGLTFTLCLVSVVVLPVYVHYLPPFMILWGLCWFFENGSGQRKPLFILNNGTILFFLFISFYLWQISGLLLADSLNVGIERIFKRLSFLLFPLVLFYPGSRIIRNIDLIIRLFAIGTFTYLIYCFGNAIVSSIYIHDARWIFNPHPLDYDFENHFIGNRLSGVVHPSYLAMYVIISILISLETLFDKTITGIRKGFWLALIFIFLIVLYLLSSRAGILSGIIILPVYFFVKFYRKLSKWIVIMILLILAVVFVGIAKTNKRIQSSVEGISKDNYDEILKNDSRILIWRSALGVIKENILFGVGTGDASEELTNEFMRRGYVNGFYGNLNAHNQFLEILLENGLIGLILFSGIFFYMSYISISQMNLLLGLFVIMIIIFFLFETVLNRLSGITFFPFLTFLLIHVKAKSDD